ncbi:MAG: hypothetical protein M0017_04620 [Desulfobacteraceae bacterium]|nr:hypothetical protein [Desulfobacteraceae bacterium]
MDIYDKAILLAALDSEYCQLSHGPFDTRENHKAVDFLVCPLGYREGEGVEVQVRELTIPICSDCADGLHDEEWTLLYCLNCLASQWILRPISRLRYRHNLIWLGSCPHCAETFGGISFNEPASLHSTCH